MSHRLGRASCDPVETHPFGSQGLSNWARNATWKPDPSLRTSFWLIFSLCCQLAQWFWTNLFSRGTEWEVRPFPSHRSAVLSALAQASKQKGLHTEWHILVFLAEKSSTHLLLGHLLLGLCFSLNFGSPISWVYANSRVSPQNKNIVKWHLLIYGCQSNHCGVKSL